jgi:GT2 family glycosyltransferase/glycosyltransferase involved in cell wall biosynthesis
MVSGPSHPKDAPFAEFGEAFAGFFDPDWYVARYPDVVRSGTDPLVHFVHFGAAECRDPNRFFDSAWYLSHYPDVANSGQHPLLHYLQSGAAELRNPHPRFDATYYVDQHPEAAANPLLYHLRHGVARGWLTEKPLVIRDYLPSAGVSPGAPPGLVVDIVIPVYRGLAQTRRCIGSVLADTDRPLGRVIVIDDGSPEPKLSAWLAALAEKGKIVVLRNQRNRGFVASVNIGIQAAPTNDVVLLNSDTEVPVGWLARLAGHAYATPRVASVSPFSNHATICGYPADAANPPAFGLGVAELDAACRAANAGRSVELPTSVGSCMYIRRMALAETGLFDAEAFGRGYGEENDFCLRAAARGWRHLLACDTFVYHRGAVSFGAGAMAAARAGMAVLQRRYPNYTRIVAQHVRRDAVAPYRFAVTLELFRRSHRPTILMLSHDLGGGVRRHVLDLIGRIGNAANCLLLQSTARGAALSVPALPGHPELVLPADRLSDLVLVLQSANVTRAHIHHLMSMDIDARALLHRLGVPFDVTVHDYFAICPQVNLLPVLQGTYCGEPDVAACNACIANRPSHGARDIVSWRMSQAWQFKQAERIICPSEDVRRRLARYGVDRQAVVVPHEPVAATAWKLSPVSVAKGRALRVAVLGVLAHHKGAVTVLSVAAASDPAKLSVHVIGRAEQELPPARLTMTGEYQEDDLPALLASVKPHILWLPAQWPETYSYTLTAAIDSGLPIVASRIGAFPERLAGRPMTWLVDAEAPAEEWIDTFEKVRGELTRPRRTLERDERRGVRSSRSSTLSGRVIQTSGDSALSGHALARPRKSIADYYAQHYLPAPSVRTSRQFVDLRRPGRISVVAIPERFGSGVLTPCAYIRLLQPLSHPAIGGDFDVVLADPDQALHYRADIVVTQRYAVGEPDAIDALTRHCRQHGIALLYDLDDDLRRIPRDHPDAALLRPRARQVSRLARDADAVWVSTPALADALCNVRDGVRVVENGIDERLWLAGPPPVPPREGPVRLLFMGTMTHDADFALVESALARLKVVFGEFVSIDLLGISSQPALPDWVNRISMPIHAASGYPGFVNWITQQHWDIGIAPLADTPFNRCKSALKALDYAALGLPILASDGPVYRGSPADGRGGWLVPDNTDAWFVALARLVRDSALRRRLAIGAREAVAGATLAAQAARRRTDWLALVHRTQQPRRESAAAA